MLRAEKSSDFKRIIKEELAKQKIEEPSSEGGGSEPLRYLRGKFARWRS